MKYVTFCIKIIIDKTFLKEHFAFTAEEEMPHSGLSLKNQTFVTTATPFGIVNVISYTGVSFLAEVTLSPTLSGRRRETLALATTGRKHKKN